MEDSNSYKIRIAAFEWLREQVIIYDDVLPHHLLFHEFIYAGERVPLLGAQGIWKPKLINKYPLSITSIPESNYSDGLISDNRLHYSYRGTDPNHRDNVGLREAMKDRIPLIYFQRIVKGKYLVHWPVYIVDDEPNELRFTIEADQLGLIQNQELVLGDPGSEYGRRQYATREVMIRVHQRSFREKVLLAYQEHCAICKLRHRELLDAAHIIPDKNGGEPIVQNGLALCKLHHAAFDQNIIGITPDYQIHVRKDILKEIDGPMLKHGIQEMHGSKLILPRSAAKRPRREWLEERYHSFSKYVGG
jgi:putative restriction endonuclease